MFEQLLIWQLEKDCYFLCYFYNFLTKFMGTTTCISENSPLFAKQIADQWKPVSHYPSQIWQSKHSGYKATIHMLPSITQIQKYQYRHLHPNFLPTILQIIPQNQLNCQSIKTPYLMMIQYIALRLRDIDYLTYAQAFYALKCVIKGYEILGHFYGPLNTNENFILINQFGSVKIWLNEDLTCNQPAQQAQIKIQKPSIKTSMYNRLRKSVRSIFSTIQNKCQKKFPSYFYSQINEFQSYDEALMLINQYLQKQKITLVHLINLEKHSYKRTSQLQKKGYGNNQLRETSGIDISFNEIQQRVKQEMSARNTKLVQGCSKQRRKNATPTPDNKKTSKKKFSVTKSVNRSKSKNYIKQNPSPGKVQTKKQQSNLNVPKQRDFSPIIPRPVALETKYPNSQYDSIGKSNTKIEFCSASPRVQQHNKNTYKRPLPPQRIIQFQGNYNNYQNRNIYQNRNNFQNRNNYDNRNTNSSYSLFTNQLNKSPINPKIYFGTQKIQQTNLNTQEKLSVTEGPQSQKHFKICISDFENVLKDSGKNTNTLNTNTPLYSKSPQKKQRKTSVDNEQKKLGKFAPIFSKNYLSVNVQDSVQFKSSLSLRYTDSQKSEVFKPKQLENPEQTQIRKSSDNKFKIVQSVLDIEEESDFGSNVMSKKCSYSKLDQSFQEKKEKIREYLMNSIQRSQLHRQQLQRCRNKINSHQPILFLPNIKTMQQKKSSQSQLALSSHRSHHDSKQIKQDSTKLKQTTQISQKLSKLVQSYHQKVDQRSKKLY